jgi:tetratricopeptide (TPR) repeat protein
MAPHPDSADDTSPLTPLDGAQGPALPLTPTEVETAVQRALASAFPPRRGWFQRRRAAVWLIAAALGVSGLAAALSGKLSLGSRASNDPPTIATPSARPVWVNDPPAPAQASAEAAPVVADAAPEPAAAAETATPAPSTRARAGSAADLLKEANRLRGQSQWAEAERLYSQVATSYSGSTQGAVAALAAASLRLEHLGDAKGALRLYQTAQRSGRLAAEADLGVASAYRALGDRPAEIGALRQLLAAYPKALFHERVARRLAVLESGAP